MDSDSGTLRDQRTGPCFSGAGSPTAIASPTAKVRQGTCLEGIPLPYRRVLWEPKTLNSDLPTQNGVGGGIRSPTLACIYLPERYPILDPFPPVPRTIGMKEGGGVY